MSITTPPTPFSGSSPPQRTPGPDRPNNLPTLFTTAATTLPLPSPLRLPLPLPSSLSSSPRLRKTLRNTLTLLTTHIDALPATTAAAALSAVAAHRLSSLSTAAGGVSQAGEVVSEVVCWAVLGVLIPLARRRGWGWGHSYQSSLARSPPSHPSHQSQFEDVTDEVVWSGDEDTVRGDGDGDGEDVEAKARLLECADAGGVSAGGNDARGVSSLWVVALGVVVACVYAAEVGEIVLFPLLTPLLLVADRRLRPEVARPWSGLAALANTAWGASLVAAVAILALIRWSPLELALSIIPVASMLIVFAALIPRNAGPRLLPHIPDLERSILPLMIRVIPLLACVLVLQGFLFGIRSIELGWTVPLLGIIKASFWYFTIHTARHTSWCTAAVIGTFGLVASQDPSLQLSQLRAVLLVIASLLAVAQLVATMPQKAKGRLALWALFLVSWGPFLANTAAVRRAQSAALHHHEHPIEVLMRNAKAEFEQLLERQSKTYTAAVEEYQRRYGVEPPPGFEEWYNFAADNKSPIIDEFDMIYESVSPFWKLSGQEVVQIMNDALNSTDIDLWLCSITGSTAQTSCSHAARLFDRNIAATFNRLLGDLPRALPDVQFLVNHLDEPRVLIPPGSGGDREPPALTDLSKLPTWDAATKFCPLQPWETHPNPSPVDTHGLPLVTNVTAALDLCAHPEYAHTHGLFQAPPTFGLIEGLVPVLSTGTLSTMGDILYPSPAYVVEPEFHYNAWRNVPWHKKSNHLYWAGSTTGAVATPSNNWRNFHRQRFLTLVQNLEPQKHTYLIEAPAHPQRPKEGGETPSTKISSIQSPFLNTHLYKTFPTHLTHCTPHSLCRQQKSHFRIRPWQSPDAPLRHKLVFDLDGNGISGRFLKLLSSSSCVLKQTVLREWHDERLVPWAHYVPVSVGMGELPEVVGWLLGTEKGGEAAREVGERGAEWVRRGVREVDLKVYLWRLVLELGRVGDGRRGVLKG